jgi:glutamate-1-semialdehyde 2,1-aminomutase
MSIAVRIARATTDRSVVAVCGYHGWHDWYLAANLGEEDALRGHLLPGLAPLGVPRELRGTTLTFAYNDRDAFQRIMGEYGSRLAAVVMNRAVTGTRTRAFSNSSGKKPTVRAHCSYLMKSPSAGV